MKVIEQQPEESTWKRNSSSLRSALVSYVSGLNLPPKLETAQRSVDQPVLLEEDNRVSVYD